MDEPLATLNRCAKREILRCLKRLNDKLAIPMIYISHDMAEMTAAMDYSSSASKVRGSWCRRRRLHPACTSGFASRPATQRHARGAAFKHHYQCFPGAD